MSIMSITSYRVNVIPYDIKAFLNSYVLLKF